jgi:stress response protein YsnF
VNKETVPVEKVRLGTETVTEQREVTEGVRKEQVEFDTDVPGQDSRGRVDAGAADAPRR